MELLEQSYKLIKEYVRQYPECSCSIEYKVRKKIDPACFHCDNLDIYQPMVNWLKLYDSEKKVTLIYTQN